MQEIQMSDQVFFFKKVSDSVSLNTANTGEVFQSQHAKEKWHG